MPTAERRLKVALVCTAPRSVPGSMQAYTHTLEHALARFAPDIDAKVLRIGPAGSEGNWARRGQTLLMLARAWAQRGIAPDVWHVLDGSRAYLASALVGAPVVITAHDVIPWLQSQGRFVGAPRTGAAARWLWRWNGSAMRAASALVCVSASTQHDVEDCFRVTAGRSRVIALPLRSALEQLVLKSSVLPREIGHVLHVGNNSFYKARSQVLRIFALLSSSHAKQLTMIGPEPTQELTALAKSLGIGDRIRWVNDPDDAVLADLYSRSSVLIFPSRYEGFGWPVLEAMAFGLPVICSNQGSLPEVAGGACPCIDPDAIDNFAAEVNGVLADPARADSLAKAGWNRPNTYSMERFAGAMRDLYFAVTYPGRLGAPEMVKS